MNITEYDIALKSYEQLQSTTVPELKSHAKRLALSGYSKMKKAELVELVYEQCNYIRAMIMAGVYHQKVSYETIVDITWVLVDKYFNDYESFYDCFYVEYLLSITVGSEAYRHMAELESKHGWTIKQLAEHSEHGLYINIAGYHENLEAFMTELETYF